VSHSINYEQVFARNVFCILGLPFDAVSLPGAADRISDSVTRKEKLFLSTPNLNWLRIADTDAEFRTSALLSDLSIADGMPVVWIARILSVPIRQRVSGSDLIDVLSRHSQMSVFFFGGEKNNAEVAVDRLNNLGLPMRAVGGVNPGHGNIEDMSSPSTLESINGQAPDFVVVSLGATKGQAWIVRNRQTLNASLISHLGAVVNFFAGTVRRAPKAMQRLGLEWAWRIFQEPRLASRYFEDATFLTKQLLCRVIPHKLLQIVAATQQRQAVGEPTLSLLETSTSITLAGSFGAANIEKIRAAFTQAMQSGQPIVIDMHQCEYFDALFAGALMLLKKCCIESGRSLSIVGAGRNVRRLFYCLNAEYLLSDEGSQREENCLSIPIPEAQAYV